MSDSTKPDDLRASHPIVLCTDGSDASNRALAAGLALFAPDAAVVIVTVTEAVDPTLVTGTGMAGGTMTPDNLDALVREQETEAEDVVRAAVAFLDRHNAVTRVLRGAAGTTLCQFAQEISARAILLGTRGRGGIKRALLGSVSDFVVRNAPCPVVVTNDL